MSAADLERELVRRRDPKRAPEPSGAVPLSIKEALAYRNSGNLPDEKGRTLRLVLHLDARGGAESPEDRRRLYEPDYLEAPSWRRDGSAPVNIVPLRAGPAAESGPWWERPELKALEQEWVATGKVAGMAVPPEYRGFVYKTVLALQAAGRAVTASAVADSIERWVTAEDAVRIRSALTRANR